MTLWQKNRMLVFIKANIPPDHQGTIKNEAVAPDELDGVTSARNGHLEGRALRGVAGRSSTL